MATLCLVVLLPSCVSFQPYQESGPPFGEEKVRVTQTSGERIVLETPRVEDGDYAGSVTSNGLTSEVRIPLDSVAGFEVLRTHEWRTALFVLGTIGAIAWGVYAFVTSIEINPMEG
jgi:hypothetical protein